MSGEGKHRDREKTRTHLQSNDVREIANPYWVGSTYSPFSVTVSIAQHWDKIIKMAKPVVFPRSAG